MIPVPASIGSLIRFLCSLITSGKEEEGINSVLEILFWWVDTAPSRLALDSCQMRFGGEGVKGDIFGGAHPTVLGGGASS